MKLTSRERRAAASLREAGERDFERDKGRPPNASELREIHKRATEVFESLARKNPGNR